MTEPTPPGGTLARSWPGRLFYALRLALGLRPVAPEPEPGSFRQQVLGTPRAEPPAGQPGEPILVETGSFRVDASRLLDKLREHQLRDPRDFILPWLRCACASGAKNIALDPAGDGLSLSFDGRPFSRAALDDPYGALLDDEADEPLRGRHFAYGLLALQRLGPDRVEVSSGRGGGRAMLVLEGRERSGETGLPEPGEGTVIRVRWQRGPGRQDVPGLLARAAAVYGLAQARLTVNGVEAPREPWRAGPPRPGTWRPVSGEGWLGYVRHFVPEPRELPSATFHIYILGTRIQTLVRHQYSSLEAYLACDALPLDLSQTGIADPARLEGILSVLTGGQSG